jgi:hypothetical protein
MIIDIISKLLLSKKTINARIGIITRTISVFL